VEGEVNTKAPGAEADPPVSVEAASVCPYVMPLAVGQVLTVGVFFCGVLKAVTRLLTFTVPMPVAKSQPLVAE
jgi:hypothetical protein